MVLQHLKVDPVLNIDATFQSSLNLCEVFNKCVFIKIFLYSITEYIAVQNTL